MPTYNHINDCVKALEACTSIDEVRELLDDFPRWSGEWWIDVIDDGNKPYYEITNQYYDKNTDEMYCDTIDLDIEVAEEDL